MKRIYVFIAIIALALLLPIVHVFSVRFDNENYRAEIAKYLSKAVQAETLRAEINGLSVPLGRDRVDSLLQALTWGKSDRKRLSKAPEAYHGTIVLYMEDLTLTLYALDGYSDAVAIEKEISGSKRWYLLERWNLFQLVQKAAGLDTERTEE